MDPEGRKTKASKGFQPGPFGINLREKREARGLTRDQAAGILNVSSRAIKHWEVGDRTPKPKVQKRILRTLEKSTVPPLPGRIAGARRNHHIDWEKGRGWFIRLTISLTTKRVGKRIKFRLKTRDIEEAIKRRDIVFSAFKALGFQVTQSGLIVPKTKPKQ